MSAAPDSARAGPRRLAEQAELIVAVVGGLSPSAARDGLRQISARTGIKEHHVAQLLVEWGRTGVLCADIRTELHHYLATHPPTARS
ncbi:MULTISPECIES: hypothetical protein [Streptomyces]